MSRLRRVVEDRALDAAAALLRCAAIVLVAVWLGAWLLAHPSGGLP